jgi:hypothetical protein
MIPRIIQLESNYGGSAILLFNNLELEVLSISQIGLGIVGNLLLLGHKIFSN